MYLYVTFSIYSNCQKFQKSYIPFSQFWAKQRVLSFSWYTNIYHLLVRYRFRDCLHYAFASVLPLDVLNMRHSGQYLFHYKHIRHLSKIQNNFETLDRSSDILLIHLEEVCSGFHKFRKYGLTLSTTAFWVRCSQLESNRILFLNSLAQSCENSNRNLLFCENRNMAVRQSIYQSCNRPQKCRVHQQFMGQHLRWIPLVQAIKFGKFFSLSLSLYLWAGING